METKGEMNNASLKRKVPDSESSPPSTPKAKKAKKAPGPSPAKKAFLGGITQTEKIRVTKEQVLDKTKEVERKELVNIESQQYVVLHCREPKSERKNHGKQTDAFTLVDSKGSKYQKFRSGGHVVSFNLDGIYAGTEKTASHLCHNSRCRNPLHVVMESLAMNKGRNGCAGPEHCAHKPKCLIVGKAFAAEASAGVPAPAWVNQVQSGADRFRV